MVLIRASRDKFRIEPVIKPGSHFYIKIENNLLNLFLLEGIN